MTFLTQELTNIALAMLVLYKFFVGGVIMDRCSSCVGDSWVHVMFKVKYCHNVFDFEEVRNWIQSKIFEISTSYKMPIKRLGMDANHLHMKLNIGVRSKPEAAKIFRGIIGRKVFQAFPWLKKNYFWGSGFWNPSYFMDNVGKDADAIEDYISKQKYVC